MAAIYLHTHPDNPEKRNIDIIAKALDNGELVILPTDTIYAIACKLSNKKGILQICKVLGKKPKKANLSLLCKDLSHISNFTRQFSNTVFKLMKRMLPGPFTFILNASNHIPKLFNTNKKTVGIRVPDNEIVKAIINKLGEPLVSSSIHSEDEIVEYLTNPDEINEEWKHKVSIIVDGGAGKNIGSTVIDCTSSNPEVIRKGLGFEEIEGLI